MLAVKHLPETSSVQQATLQEQDNERASSPNGMAAASQKRVTLCSKIHLVLQAKLLEAAVFSICGILFHLAFIQQHLRPQDKIFTKHPLSLTLAQRGAGTGVDGMNCKLAECWSKQGVPLLLFTYCRLLQKCLPSAEMVLHSLVRGCRDGMLLVQIPRNAARPAGKTLTQHAKTIMQTRNVKDCSQNQPAGPR